MERTHYTIAVLVLLALSGCSRKETIQFASSGPRPQSGEEADGSPRLTVGPMYGRQLLASYVNVTGVTMNTALATAFEEAKDQLPQAGVSGEVSTTVVFATTTLAGQVCNAFVTKERGIAAAERRAFGPIDFTKTPSSITDESFGNTANNLAKLFLSRELTVPELVQVAKAKAAALDGAPSTTATVQNLSLILCTAVASSVEATQL